MVLRSSLIFAATLAVLSTFDAAYCVAGHGPDFSEHDLQRPRFMKKNVKRYYQNTTSNYPTYDPVQGNDQLNEVNVEQAEAQAAAEKAKAKAAAEKAKAKAAAEKAKAQAKNNVVIPPTSSTSTTSSSTTSSSTSSPSPVEPAVIAPTKPPVSNFQSKQEDIDDVDDVDDVADVNKSPSSSSSSSSSSSTTGTSGGSSPLPNAGGAVVKTGDDKKDDKKDDTKDGVKNVVNDVASSSSIPAGGILPQGSKTQSVPKNDDGTKETPPPVKAVLNEDGTKETPSPEKGVKVGGQKEVLNGDNKPPPTSPTSTPPSTPPAPGLGQADDDDTTTTPTEDEETKDQNPPKAGKSSSTTGAPINPSDVVGGVQNGAVKDVNPSKVVENAGAVVKQPDTQSQSAPRDRFGAGASASDDASNPRITPPVVINDEKPEDTDGSGKEKGNDDDTSDSSTTAAPDVIDTGVVKKPVDVPAKIPASITSDGKLIPNPEASGTSPPKDEGVIPGGVKEGDSKDKNKDKTPKNSPALENGGKAGTKPPASIVLDNGSVVPNPVQIASGSQNTAASITLPNGKVVPNPALITPPPEKPEKVELNEDKSDSTTLPNGQVVPIQKFEPGSEDNNTTEDTTPIIPIEKEKSNGQQSVLKIPSGAASVTLPNGDVVPASAVPAGASVTLPNGDVVPASAVPVGAFTTLPNGKVVPVSPLPAAGASVTLPNGDVVPASAVPSLNRPVEGAVKKPVVNPPSPVSGSAVPPGVQIPTGPSNTGVPPPINHAVEHAPGVSQPPPGPTAGPVASQSQSYNVQGNGPISQKPVGYDGNTVLQVDSSITYEASSAPPTTGTEALPTGIPSDVPLVLYPPTGKQRQPLNTVLIQIGFLFPLNYDFVWTHDQSQKQIFEFLPIGVATCLGIETINVTMQTLRAWDTTQDLHYITTLALMWIPFKLVNDLDLAVRQPAGKFYNQPNPSIRTLLSMVNNAIPIRADNMDDSGTGTDGSASNPAATSDTAPVGGNIGSSSPVKASSVGIGVGVVCGAAAYGAAMFFVARRYKKRRQNHMRSPSMFSSPVMSHAGGDPAAGQALMSGAMGGERSVSPYYDRAESRGSARSGGSSGRQQISAPVMAENSLGWN